MSNEAKSAPRSKTVRVKIITNYGRWRPGEWIEVSEQEYQKFRRVDDQGKLSFPVFISQADMDAEAERAKKAEAEKLDRHKHADERSRSEGWLNFQRESARIVAARRIEEQKAQHETLLGVPSSNLTEDQKAAQFRQNVAAARTG